LVLDRAGEVEWQKEKHKARHEYEASNGVEFDEIMPEALCQGAGRLSWFKKTLFSSLVLMPEKDGRERGNSDRQNDGKSTISPAPVIGSARYKAVYSIRNRERCTYEWRLGHGKDQDSVLEARNVGDPDGENIVHAVVANVVDDSRGSVARHACARCKQDQAQSREESHQEKTFGTPPEIEDLGDRQTQNSTNDR